MFDAKSIPVLDVDNLPFILKNGEYIIIPPNYYFIINGRMYKSYGDSKILIYRTKSGMNMCHETGDVFWTHSHKPIWKWE